MSSSECIANFFEHMSPQDKSLKGVVKLLAYGSDGRICEYLVGTSIDGDGASNGGNTLYRQYQLLISIMPEAIGNTGIIWGYWA